MDPVILSDRDVMICLSHKPGDGTPFEYWPNECYHFEEKDGWDTWENKIFKEHYPQCMAYFSSMLSFVKRTQKLNNKRKLNKTYCLKVRPTRKHNPRFKYYGDLLN